MRLIAQHSYDFNEEKSHLKNHGIVRETLHTTLVPRNPRTKIVWNFLCMSTFVNSQAAIINTDTVIGPTSPMSE